MNYDIVDSPLGDLLVVGDDAGLRTISMQAGPDPARVEGSWTPDPDALEAARTQLDEYFAGQRTRFELSLDPQGTPFQKRVWGALAQIPYGETRSYAELARAIGRPAAARAVGAANGRNPLAIVVPCHRVVGADGSLTGFGGGIDRKRLLLELERAGDAAAQALAARSSTAAIRPT